MDEVTPVENNTSSPVIEEQPTPVVPENTPAEVPPAIPQEQPAPIVVESSPVIPEPPVTPEIQVQQPVVSMSPITPQTSRKSPLIPILSVVIVLVLIGAGGVFGAPALSKHNFQKSVTTVESDRAQEIDLEVAQAAILNGIDPALITYGDDTLTYDARNTAINTITAAFQSALAKDGQIQQLAQQEATFAPTMQYGKYKDATSKLQAALTQHSQAVTKVSASDSTAENVMGAYLLLCLDLQQAAKIGNTSDDAEIVALAAPLAKYEQTTYTLPGESELLKTDPSISTATTNAKATLADVYHFSQAVSSGDSTTALALIDTIAKALPDEFTALGVDISKFITVPEAAYQGEIDSIDSYITDLQSVNATFDLNREVAGYVNQSILKYSETNTGYPIASSLDALKAKLSLKYADNNYLKYSSVDGNSYDFEYKQADGTWKNFGQSSLDTKQKTNTSADFSNSAATKKS